MSEAPALAPKPFYYLRHGETEWNRLRLCQGSADIPLYLMLADTLAVWPTVVMTYRSKPLNY